MPRRALPSTRLAARVRAWFGLTQDELALYLGVSPALVRHLESGRRALSTGVQPALLTLFVQLPVVADGSPRPAAAPTKLSPGTLPPDLSELDFRRRVCLQQVARLSAQAEPLAQQARVAERWMQALPALLAATPALAETADRTAWRIGWLHRRARPLPAEAATRWHLLQARIVALRAEAEALAAMLAGSAPD